MRALLLLLASFMAVPAAAEPVRVAVAPDKDGFIADFTFPADAPAWGFWRSSTAAADNQSWRAKSWQVLTPGVTLQRRGQHDALAGENGQTVPRHVRVRLTPFTGDLNANYVPALDLGSGTVALFDGHFALFSVDQAEKLDSLAPGFDPTMVGDHGTAVTFKGRRLRIAGDVEGYRAGRSSGAYAIFGSLPTVTADGVGTIVDSELPKWLTDYLAGFTPKVIRALTTGLGPAGLDQPTILASWEGTDIEGASMNGGTLKGLILMRFEGEQAVNELPALRDMARVVRRGGRLGITAWSSRESEYRRTWEGLMNEFVDVRALDYEALPWEEWLEKGENVVAALSDAGLTGVTIDEGVYPIRMTVESFLAMRETSTSARYLRQAEPAAWERFRESVAGEFVRRYRDPLLLTHRAWIGTGIR